jgi:hypothetical protein
MKIIEVRPRLIPTGMPIKKRVSIIIKTDNGEPNRAPDQGERVNRIKTDKHTTSSDINVDGAFLTLFMVLPVDWRKRRRELNGIAT